MHRPTLLAILFSAFAQPLFGQTADVTGRVTDASDAVVPGVMVTVVHRDTGVARVSVSNEDGYYSVPALPPGTYVVTAEREGFTPAVRDELVLVNDQAARADFVLRPGAVDEQVQVTAQALLESETAAVGSVVTERSIHELPLNVRDPISLATLTPGVTTTANFGAGGGTGVGRNFFRANFRVAGGRNRGQDVLLDGVASEGERTVIDRFFHVVVGDTLVVSPTTTAEIRAGFARAHAEQVAPAFDLMDLGFPAYMSELDAGLWPQFGIADITDIGNGFVNNQPRNTYSVVGQVHRSAGRHFFKVGVDFRVLQFNAFENVRPAGVFSFTRSMTQGPVATQASAAAGHGVASFLLGAGSGGSVDHRVGLSLQRRYSGLFVQDDWRVTPRLTLNLGLRYDVATGQTERNDRLTWLDLDAPSPLAEATGLPLRGLVRFAGTDGPRNQLDTDWNNVAPRVGLAYRAGPDTVVRAGYGLFYAPMPVRRIGSIGFDNETPWVASVDGLVPTNYLRDPFPQGFNVPTGERDPLTNVGFDLTSTTRNERVGYTQQWSVSAQRQLGEHLLVDVAYLGNKGTKLQSGVVFEENSLAPEHLALGNALNELVDNPFYRLIESGPLSGPTVTRRQLLLPYPQYTSVARQFPMATSAIYHAMAVKAERRTSRGLTLLASYVWSKLIDEASDQVGGTSILNFYDRRAERSLSTYDVPYNLVVSAVYDLPFGRNRRLATNLSRLVDALVGDWTIAAIASWRSGFPVRVNRPAVRNDGSARLDNPTIERWFDTDVFSPAAPFTFGNVSRTLPDARTDGVKNVDMTFSKSVHLGRYRLQIRADVCSTSSTARSSPRQTAASRAPPLAR
jgi:hypothetical protein